VEDRVGWAGRAGVAAILSISPLTGFKQDQPVTDGARPVGARTHGNPPRSLARRVANLPVQQAMRSEPEAGRLPEALPMRMHRGECPVRESAALEAFRTGALAAGSGRGTGR
jgi:hypothetical protein